MFTTQSAGGIVLNKDNQILLVNQKHTSWSLPKGHVENGEEIFTAAKREIFEETGVSELTFIASVGSYSRMAMESERKDDTDEYKTIHLFLFTTTQINLVPQDKDNPEARWVWKDEITNYLLHEEDRKFVTSVLEKYLSGAYEADST